MRCVRLWLCATQEGQLNTSLLRAQSLLKSLPLPILSLGLPRPRGGCRPCASERSAPGYLPLIT